MDPSMKNSKKSQAGFSALYIVLAVAVIGLIGIAFAIVAISQKQKNTDTTDSSTVTNDTVNTDTTSPNPSTTTPPISQSDPAVANSVARALSGGTTSSSNGATSAKLSNNTLPISQWGVSMHTTVALGVVSYKYDSAGNIVQLNSALQKKLPASCQYATTFGWGIQQRTPAEVPENERSNYRLIRGIYYGLLVPAETCSDATDQMNELDTNYRAMYDSLS